MRFGILGPLEVAENAGRRLKLGGHRQRAVLAILLLHANEVVSSDRLVEDLWSGRPPASAATSLQAHVSRLRRALGEDERIVTTGGGYLIRVAPDELDRDRFERLVEEGSAAVVTEGWELASAKLREALSLWRGAAMADFAYDSFAQAEISRLDEMRLSAVEQRVEAELALGREATVIGDLERLVGEHPYRERLRGQLMLALYRTGRQAEALAAYREVSGVLRDELGLEPGESLRELERAILGHDPSLSEPPAAKRREEVDPAARAAALPAGTVTFLFTDIEGSTRLLGELGSERYSEELGRHREVVRRVVAARGGHVFGTEGDAFFVAFARVSDALGAANEVQAGLGDGLVRVRVGVHTGEPLLVEGNYVGLDVHKAARICGVAHGGQVVVSQATHDLAGLELRDLGWHRLKDLAAPERLFQLGAGDFPALGTVGVTSLPVQRTPFLGRVDELAEISALLRGAGARLVTLTGAGGSGKTRLALQAAQACAEEHRDGAWFVGFADVTDPGLIAPAICRALTLVEQLDLTPAQRLEAYLRDRELLLVLDNLEQLTPGAGVLGELLALCPGVRMLVTSREPLHLAGEQQYEVPVLNPGDAIELFTARANTVSPNLDIDRDTAGAVCERLDRLPLAIELAAARTKILTPEEILDRLERRLPVAATGPRDAPQRQRTLQATIDWSYNLLNAEDQRLFARLSVFAGGFTLTAAQTVCGADLDTLQALLDRSLVRRDSSRYSMLATIREYALEHLNQGGEGEEIHKAHAQWLVELLEAQGLPQPGWPDAKSRAIVVPEQENFTAALEWASRTGRSEILARLAGPLVGVWLTQGQLHEADRWMKLVLDNQESYSGLLAAQVLSAAAALARQRGEYNQGVMLGQQALEYWREVGDARGIGMTLVELDPSSRGAIADAPRERAALEQAIQFARDNDLTEILAFALDNLADLVLSTGDVNEGRALCEESLAVSILGSGARDIAVLNLAYIETVEGRPSEAEQLIREALESALLRGDLLVVANSAIAMAWPLAQQGRLQLSAQLLGAGLGFLHTAGAVTEWMDDSTEAGVLNILHSQLDAENVEALLVEGRDRGLEAVVREALNDSRRGREIAQTTIVDPSKSGRRTDHH